LPFSAAFISALSAAALGAAARFLDTRIELSRTRHGGLGLRVLEDPYSQELAAEASYTIRSVKLAFYRNATK
jgi:alkylation response protein AidB-like acyl-CoA dehydrogenase